MNKQQFIETLKQALPHVSPSDLADILADFEEHFSSGLARGKSEAEICAELGSPQEIALQYRDGWSGDAVTPQTGPAPLTAAQAMPSQPLQPQPLYPDPQLVQPAAAASPAKPGAKVNEGALIVVILLNLLVGIPVWIALFSTLFGLWTAAGGIGVAAVVLFVVAIVQAGITSLVLALFGLSLTALTVLAIILMVYLTKWLCIGLVKYIRWNRDLVMGGSPA